VNTFRRLVLEQVVPVLIAFIPAVASAGPYHFWSKFGSYGSGNGQFISPTTIAVDAQGDLYVADYGNERVEKFSASGEYMTQWGGHGSGNGQFDVVGVVVAGPDGHIYVSDWNNGRVEAFEPDGTYLTSWGSSGSADGQLFHPLGVAVDTNGDVFVADQGNSRIVVFSSSGSLRRQWGTFGGGPGQFFQAYGLAFGPDGNVYVTDGGNDRIQVFDKTGHFIRQWGTTGTAGGQFHFPHQLAIDGRGDVFVTDNHNNRVEKFTSTGAFITAWGDSGGDDGQFDDPIGIALDDDGGLLVADAHNHRIQRFLPGPVILSASDVGNDQGRHLSLRFSANTWDYAGSPLRVDRYDVYRRRGPFAPPADTWDYVGVSIRADSSAEYTLVVPTLGDSNCTGAHPSAFRVRAATNPPDTSFDSPVALAGSLDNLAPAAPVELIGNYTIATHTTHLHWMKNMEADFATYRLYRDRAANFVPGVGNLISTLADTGYTDPDCYPPGCFYKICSVDTSCNASAFVRLAPWETAAVPSRAETILDLATIHPNPIRGERLDVEFTLGAGGMARIELLDIAGRRVASRSLSDLAAGYHKVDLASGRRIAPGIYSIRLVQGGHRVSREICVVR
jgi:streptogramin lyase